MLGKLPTIGSGTTLVQGVYAALRQRLIENPPEPGTFLREPDLAQAMGVSRTPIREALARLASEGLIERIPHRGYRLPERSLRDLFDLYPVMQALEVLAGSLAFPRLVAADLDRLAAINLEFAEALRNNDVEAAVDLNDEFHRVFAMRCGNAVLQEMVEDLRVQIRRLELWDFAEVLKNSGEKGVEHWVRQHELLLHAVRNGRFEYARALLQENRTVVYVTAHEAVERSLADNVDDAHGGAA
jgi:DNA-binding GntR family transcriptional regulator